MSQQALLMGIPWRPILVASADFDGSNDLMATGSGLTGAADGKVGTVMFWFRLDGGDGVDMTILHAATTVGGAVTRWRVRRVNTTNVIEIIGVNAAGVTILDIETTTAYTASATWRQLLASWDLATAAAHLYITGVSDLTSTTLTNDSVDYTVADWAIGAQASGGTKFNGCLSEAYLALEYVDLSSAANRAKFITTTGKPMYLGTDGSVPTGTAPLVYQRVIAGAAASTFATNVGSAEDFVITGTLDLGSSSPSD